ncbi:hypothetical protein ACUOFC_60855, partial [Escherichia sp. TWPC-MK]
MNYSHDNWSAILAHIGKPEELDTSARISRRRVRAPALRAVTAWAQLHDVATLSDV